MVKWWPKIFKNQLLQGSFVLFIGSALASFGNYLYHLLMGRMLGPIDYGVLASLISLAYLFNIPIGTLNMVVVKYVSQLRGKKELAKINYLYAWLTKKLLLFSVTGCLLLVIASPLMAAFLHFDSVLPLLMMIISSLIAVFANVNTATLQGFLRFGWMSLAGIVQAVLKVGGAVLLVWLGWKVLGAVAAALLAGLTGLILTIFLVKKLLKRKSQKQTVNIREIYRYSLPVLFSNLAFTSLYTTDILLAKHFLAASDAGFYAALAVLGKIIFFAAGPIIMVMFPMISERHANDRKFGKLFNLSFGLVCLVCLGISLIYLLFPKLMISILYGPQYLVVADKLWLFAIFLSLYSFAYLLMNFFLSIKKTKVVVLPVMAALTQAIFIFVFHQDLDQIVLVSIIILFLLFAGLLVYYLFNHD